MSLQTTTYCLFALNEAMLLIYDLAVAHIKTQWGYLFNLSTVPSVRSPLSTLCVEVAYSTAIIAAIVLVS